MFSARCPMCPFRSPGWSGNSGAAERKRQMPEPPRPSLPGGAQRHFKPRPNRDHHSPNASSAYAEAFSERSEHEERCVSSFPQIYPYEHEVVSHRNP